MSEEKKFYTYNKIFKEYCSKEHFSENQENYLANRLSEIFQDLDLSDYHKKMKGRDFKYDTEDANFVKELFDSVYKQFSKSKKSKNRTLKYENNSYDFVKYFLPKLQNLFIKNNFDDKQLEDIYYRSQDRAAKISAPNKFNSSEFAKSFNDRFLPAMKKTKFLLQEDIGMLYFWMDIYFRNIVEKYLVVLDEMKETRSSEYDTIFDTESPDTQVFLKEYNNAPTDFEASVYYHTRRKGSKELFYICRERVEMSTSMSYYRSYLRSLCDNTSAYSDSDNSGKTYSFANIIEENNGDYSNDSKYISTFFEDIGLLNEWKDLSYYNKSFTDGDKNLITKILESKESGLVRRKDKKTGKKHYVDSDIIFLTNIINDIYTMFSLHLSSMQGRYHIYRTLSDYMKSVMSDEMSIGQAIVEDLKNLDKYIDLNYKEDCYLLKYDRQVWFDALISDINDLVSNCIHILIRMDEIKYDLIVKQISLEQSNACTVESKTSNKKYTLNLYDFRNIIDPCELVIYSIEDNNIPFISYP